MKRTLSLFLCLSLASCALSPAFTGCGLAPYGVFTGDPVVVNSEKIISESWDSVNAFLRREHRVRGSISPNLHATAQSVRAKAPDMFRNARAVLRSYKANPTPEQKALLDTWMASLIDLAKVANETY
jgi:hypothetical protein